MKILNTFLNTLGGKNALSMSKNVCSRLTSNKLLMLRHLCKFDMVDCNLNHVPPYYFTFLIILHCTETTVLHNYIVYFC